MWVGLADISRIILVTTYPEERNSIIARDSEVSSG
jgi:hypothetical protein